MNDEGAVSVEQRDQLIAAARNVRLNAYAPYSTFLVGASVLTENGEVFTGVNVENASYGLTICAERAAIFAAATAGARKIRAVAVVTDARKPSAPCGACRQVAWEFAVRDYVGSPGLPIFLAVASTGEIETVLLQDLLPNPFGPPDLAK
jgi:cytidine deaminase